MNGATQLVGLIGWPVSHSQSPQMHNAAFAHLGLNWVYVPMPVHPDPISVENALKGLRALGFKGVNVTVPHKEAVLPFMDELSPSAKAIGAVNTLCFLDSGKVRGENTDAPGFIADLVDHGVDVVKAKALVLGAGGSARAVVYGLLQAGCMHVTLVNRTLDKAQKLQQDMQALFPEAHINVGSIDQAASLIVNCTSLGMGDKVDQMPWPAEVSFLPHQVIYDLIYNPNPTRLLQKATSDGATAISGRGMLVHQGALSFTLWTGKSAPFLVMKGA